MIVALIFAALVASSVAINDGRYEYGRIQNGTQATPGQIPYIVSVTYNKAHICGGFVYNERFAVTAASCVSGVDTRYLNVVVGELSLISPDPGEQIIDVVGVTVFDGYNNVTKLHDIAIIEAARPFVFSDTCSFIRYEEVDDLASPISTIAGWGALTDGGLVSTRLRMASVTLFPTDCRQYGNDEYNINYNICVGAQADYVSPCVYDEGSPVVQNGLVVGIMSKNRGCGIGDKWVAPTIYTRLAAYYPWLIKYAGQQPASK